MKITISGVGSCSGTKCDDINRTVVVGCNDRGGGSWLLGTYGGSDGIYLAFNPGGYITAQAWNSGGTTCFFYADSDSDWCQCTGSVNNQGCSYANGDGGTMDWEPCDASGNSCTGSLDGT
jgi:hypothetical protein